MLRRLSSMLGQLKLREKFTLLLVIVFFVGITLSGVAFANVLNQRAEDEITSKALILLQTMNSVREYTSSQVNPELAPRLAAEFIPESVPAYSAREVFEDFRKQRQYSEFFYKEATLNPTNLRDKADNFETTIVEKFRSNPGTKELRGFRAAPGGDLFYIARPLQIKKASCLVCHSTPEAAPQSMIEQYGTENGFGWKLNEIVGAQIISVPAQGIVSSAQRSFMLLMGIVFFVFAFAIFIMNWLLNRFVVRPINRLSRVAEQVSMGQMDAEFEQMSRDEVGSLADAFTRMKLSLGMAMKMLDQTRGGGRKPPSTEGNPKPKSDPK